MRDLSKQEGLQSEMVIRESKSWIMLNYSAASGS